MTELQYIMIRSIINNELYLLNQAADKITIERKKIAFEHEILKLTQAKEALTKLFNEQENK